MRLTASRTLWIFVCAGVLVTLAVAYGMATQSVPLGSREGRWTFLYVRPFRYQAVLIAALASACAAGLLCVRPPRTARGAWGLLAAWIILATALHGAIRSSSPYTLESLFVSEPANSFYSVTERHAAADVLGRFQRIRSQSPLHARSNMPGKVMLTYALERISDRTDVLPWLVVALSNLGAVFMYLFVRDLLEDQTAALYAAVLYLFVPARIFFFPIMNTVTPVWVLACAWLFLRWLRFPSPWRAAWLGVAIYGLAFFEPLPLVVGLLFAALAARALAIGRISPERLALHFALGIVAFIAASELVHLAFGFEFVRAFKQIGAHAAEFNAAEGRPYGHWLRANLWEFSLGVGFCQILLFAATLTRGGDTLRWREWLTRPIVAFCLGVLALLLVTNLLGVNRGEVIRLWIFIACLFQVPAAYACAAARSPGALAAVVACALLHAAVGTTMIGFVVP